VRGPVVASITVAVALAPGWAAAAPHPLTTKRVASGVASVTSCGTLSGLAVAWTVRSSAVTQVSLASIPSACIGGTLSLTLAAADNSSIGTAGPASVTATSMTLAVTGAPTASGISHVQFAVVGP
jgi:hypothetical protein